MKFGGDTNRYAVLASAMACMLVMGIYYDYSLIQPVVMQYFRVDSAAAGLPFSILIAAFCIGNFTGAMIRRRSSLPATLAAGYGLMIAGLALTALLPPECFWAMPFTYGVIFGIGDGIIYNAVLALMPKWFPDKKGVASGLTLGMMGLSAAIFSPVLGIWLRKYGFSGTYFAQIPVYAAAGAVGLLMLKDPPADGVKFKDAGQKNAALKINEIFCSRTFWILTGLYFCAVPAYLLLSALFVTFGAEKGLAFSTAALGVSLASLCQIAGRFILPALSDVTGRKTAFTIGFLISTAAAVVLPVSSGALYILCFCMLSFSYGGIQACFTPTIADSFGTDNVGTVLSLTMAGLAAGSLGASLVLRNAGISAAILCAGAVSFIGVILVCILPGEKRAACAGRRFCSNGLPLKRGRQQ